MKLAMVGKAHPTRNEVDASIAAKAEFEYLYDQSYEDKGNQTKMGWDTIHFRIANLKVEGLIEKSTL